MRGIMTRLGLNGVPHAFAFDKEGKLIWHGHPNQCENIVKKLDKSTDNW